MPSIDEHSTELDRILSFFGRVESKSSFLLGTNIGVVAIALYNLDYRDISTWYVMGPLVVALILIAYSTYNLYEAAYPQLAGGEESLIYFKSIASNTEAGFIKKFEGMSEDELKGDLAGQIWRNAQILSLKFSSVQAAYRYTLFSLVPWAIFLFSSSIIHSRVLLVR